jgi:hypothetical protein
MAIDYESDYCESCEYLSSDLEEYDNNGFTVFVCNECVKEIS